MKVSDYLWSGLAVVFSTANQGRDLDGRQAIIGVVVAACLYLAGDADNTAWLLQEG